MKTTRQYIERQLRLSIDGVTATALAEQIEDAAPGDVLDHIDHIARSLEHDDAELLVAPPRCPECGFDRFDDRANIPSRCPECRAENVEEPTFTIE